MAIAPSRGRRLVLHFDINNTILIRDNAKKMGSVNFTVARIVCQSSWGRLTPAAESDQSSIPNWHLAYDQLSWTKPQNV